MEGNYHNNNDDAFASDGSDYDMSDAEEEEQEEAKVDGKEKQEQHEHGISSHLYLPELLLSRPCPQWQTRGGTSACTRRCLLLWMVPILPF